jgi:signal transduction histidine kinase
MPDEIHVALEMMTAQPADARERELVQENARLLAAEQRLAEQFQVLSEFSTCIISILDVEELLAQTVRLIRQTFGYYHIHIGLIEDGLVTFSPRAGLLRDEGSCAGCASHPLRVGVDGICGRVAGSGQPILVQDVTRDERLVMLSPGQTGSELALPLQIKGRVIGVLDVESERPNAFCATDVAMLQSFANQTAVALENARLYKQAQQLAALEERQRLARELHDSVSQALYGIALGARTARALLDRDVTQVAEPLEYVLALAEAGLTDMRALIFELRPESLQSEGLVVALTKLTDSLRARHHLAVRTQFDVEPDIPLQAKEALYRVAQEALRNIIKHAQSCLVTVQLDAAPRVRLEIADNGAGFDPNRDYPGHLGLRSMRERVEKLGGQLVIDSAPGRGTRIALSL